MEAHDDINPAWHCHHIDSSLHFGSHSDSKECLRDSRGHLNSKKHEFKSKSKSKLSDCDNNIIYNQVTLDFKIRIEDTKNQDILAKATFTYKYFPSDDSIEYIDIMYTHPKLQSVIECNPNIMKNIDSHIRDLLLVQKIRN
jgi:hypothetical protein